MGVAILAFRQGASGVNPQPLVEPARLKVHQNGLDRGFVVAVHADHGLQRLTGQAVTLDQKPVVHVRRPRRRVDHERVDPLPFNTYRVRGHQLLPRPLELLAIARHRPLNDRRGKGHQVVDELGQGPLPPALDELILDLGGHAFNAQLGLFPQPPQHRLFQLLRLLLELRRGGCCARHQCLLVHLLHKGLLQRLGHVRRQLRQGRVLQLPRAIQARAHQGVAQPGTCRPALDRGHPQKQLRATKSADFRQFRLIVLTAPAPQTVRHAFFHVDPGIFRVFPARADVRRQRLDNRFRLGLLIRFAGFVFKLRRRLERHQGHHGGKGHGDYLLAAPRATFRRGLLRGSFLRGGLAFGRGGLRELFFGREGEHRT